ncbi:calcium-binding protein CML14 [Spatholobus suberectus]|nr:calcium-binding protein CML14 [Spatholobus suberectus]
MKKPHLPHPTSTPALSASPNRNHESFDRQLCNTIKVLNQDSTSFVSIFELRHNSTNIGEKLKPFEFNEWIRELDVGSDGMIRFEDFITIMVAK